MHNASDHLIFVTVLRAITQLVAYGPHQDKDIVRAKVFRSHRADIIRINPKIGFGFVLARHVS